MATTAQESASMEERARKAGIPVMHYDIEKDPAFRQDVFGMFDKAREAGPIIYSTAARGYFVFSEFNLLEDTLKSPDIFSSGALEVHRSEAHVFGPMIPETLDPPEHHAYRTALAPMFSPRSVSAFEDRFRQRTRAYIEERFVGKKEVDFMELLGRPLPADFFLDLVGIPEHLHTPITDALMTATYTLPEDDPTGEIRGNAAKVVVDAVNEMIDEKLARPADDVFTAITQREVNGRRMTRDELFSIGILLANAGVETTGGALGYIFEFLAQNPGHRRHIIDNIGNTVPAIEELLRVFPVANSGRIVAKEADFHGVHFMPGDRVIINRIAANRDPRLLERGDEVVLDRKFNNHTTFGDGIHTCLGSHVARREIRIVIEEWHKLIPEYRLAPGFKPYHHTGTTISLNTLPMILG